MRLVVEHMRGKRRGERDVFDSLERISLGRHPQNDVAFDPRADLDASSRHAEIRCEKAGYVLRDIGSSNGTFVDGELVHELVLEPGRAFQVDLGAGGPRVRLWLGAGDPAPDAPARPRRLRVGHLVFAALALAAAIGIAVLLAC